MVARIAVALSMLIIGIAISRPALAQGAVEGWVSSVNLEKKLTPEDGLAFGKLKKRPKMDTIAVDTAKTYQSIVGIGSSLEHATCYNLSLIDADRRAKVIEDLVHPETGIGMSLMRLCIGTSDFVGEPWYSYNDLAEGQTDPDLAQFSIEKDRAYLLPTIKLALEKNPELKFFASPWSPPGWMKDSGRMCGGRLLPEWYDAYAKYLVRFIEAYDAEGVPILAITPQNEPGVNVKTYPSCFFKGPTQAEFIKKSLGPAFRDNFVATQIWCFDHNFNNTAFPRAVLSDPDAAPFVEGTGFHLYEGKPESMGAFQAEFPEKSVYFTEGSVYGTRGAAEIIEYFRNSARTYNAWVTIIDQDGKPNNGPHNCSPTCIVLHTDTLELEYRFDYYMYGHFSKFIRPGAVRVESTPGDRKFSNIAFRNTDGSMALVVVNGEPTERRFRVAVGEEMFETALPGRSVATYRWRA